MPYLLGIDAGSTVTKATMFDLEGRVAGESSARISPSYPAPRHVERDQDELWAALTRVVRAVLVKAGLTGQDVVAVGVTSHGDGAYLVDEAGRPTRPGVMSLDTRARGIVEEWDRSGVSDDAFKLTGQRPWPSSPSAVMAWIQRHEPEVLIASRWVLPAKDMLRQRLTGTFSTEPTEASLSFTNVETQVYDETVLDLFGLGGIRRLLPPVVPSTSALGVISAEAAEATGLAPGTPVGSGAHDVDCAAVGTGVVRPGTVSVVAGTFSINQVISDEPVLGRGWFARNFVLERQWMNMAISPTSATNMEWFATQMCADDLARSGEDPFAFVETEVARIADTPSDVVYLPYLFGSPLDQDASGTFAGLRGWHKRGHLLRAVMEGVTFVHRRHIDDLDSAFTSPSARLTGGASRSPRWSQMFADTLGRLVEVTDVPEAAGLGAALLAGVGAGVYDDLDAAVDRTVRVRARYEPEPGAVAAMSASYRRFRDLTAALLPVWEQWSADEARP